MRIVSIIKPWITQRGVRLVHSTPITEVVKKKFREDPTKTDYLILAGFGGFILYSFLHVNQPKRGLHYTGLGFFAELIGKPLGKLIYRKNIREEIKKSKIEDYKNKKDLFYRIWMD
jgi:hypothetical protein